MAGKKILVAPLDWGLGHATRCIPLIRELMKAGHDVIIAADGKGEHILREEFPGLKFIFLKGYHLRYSKYIPAWLKILFQLPKIILRIAMEHAELKKLIRDHKIDVVVSDSRFGLWNKNICSVYITHQVMIKCPAGLKVFEPAIHAMHRWIIRQFDYCWIPDFAGKANLSGDLSHKYALPENTAFINPLSRFNYQNTINDFKYDLCIIISGPEPLRGELEKIMLSLLKAYNGKSILILGKPGHKQDAIDGNTRIVSYMGSAALEEAIVNSRMVICRAGYSGIMDLNAMKKNALLIPTPGQTEQEYLAAYLSAKKIFAAVDQPDISLENMKWNPEFSVDNMNAGAGIYSPLSDAINRLKDCGPNNQA